MAAVGGRVGTNRAPWLAATTIAYLVWSIGPLVVAVAFSFNAGRSISRWDGISLQWWAGSNPFSPGLLHDPELMAALRHSMLLAAISTLLVVPVGSAFALGYAHLRSRLSRVLLLVLIVLPLALPPVFLGTMLWIVFVQPLRSFPFGSLGWFGTRGQVAGLVGLYLPLATLVVLARLLLLDRHPEEMAADLGAPPTDIVRRVLLPQLWTAILAAATVVFASALGEFVVVDRLVGSNETRALAPALLGARNGPTPVDNAIGSLLALVGLVATATMALAFRSSALREIRQPLGRTS
jgi:spermidine/putrescine transport system permease protein